MKQRTLRLDIQPPFPTIRHERIAKRIAERIVAAVNLDDFYWESGEIADRIYDIQQEIMLGTDPRGVIDALYWKQPPFNCLGQRGGHPYGWDGIHEHCEHIASDIASEELRDAVRAYRRTWCEDSGPAAEGTL